MLDKTIDSALLNLRRDLIRSGGEGLEHVEALLTLRNVPMPRVMPKQAPDRAGHGVMKMMILDALRDGPKTLRELAAYVAENRPEISAEAAYKRTGQALANMKSRALIVHNMGLWRLRVWDSEPDRH